MRVFELMQQLEDMDPEAIVMLYDENGEYADLESLSQGYLDDDDFEAVDQEDVDATDPRDLVVRLAAS